MLPDGALMVCLKLFTWNAEQELQKKLHEIITST